MDEYECMLIDCIKIVVVVYVFNVLGIINLVEEIIVKVYDKGILVLFDGVQVMFYLKVDV